MSKKKIEYNLEDKAFTFLCPHCDILVQVLHHETNCRIFRHGVYIENGQQMNPHSPKEECDRLLTENKIIGCGKPFIIYLTSEPYVEPCDYI